MCVCVYVYACVESVHIYVHLCVHPRVYFGTVLRVKKRAPAREEELFKCHSATHCNTLCNTLCNSLQRIATPYNTSQHMMHGKRAPAHEQEHSKCYAATHCNTLQQALQQTATDCNRLQQTATHQCMERSIPSPRGAIP